MRALCLTVSLIAMAHPALAQEESGEEAARVHFNAGRLYFDEGNYDQALVEFQTANTLSPRPAMYFNIGVTQERLARLEEAIETLERYLREVPDAGNRDLVTRRIANMRRRLAGGGGGDSGLVIGGAVSLAVAGVAAVTFAILGGLTVSADADIQNGCDARGDCTEADLASVRDLSLGADIAWPIALGAGTLGAVLLILGITSSTDSTSAEVVPIVSPTVAGILIGGSL